MRDRGFAARIAVLGLALLAPAGPPRIALADPAPDSGAVAAALSSLRERHARETASTRLPVRFETRVTAWQESPRSLVVSGDPAPGELERQPLTHPFFLFGWADGRQLLVDAGLARAEADAFGGPAEWLGADPMRCVAGAWAPVAAPGRRLAAVVFTHLHVDHTTGVRELCREGAAVPVRLSPEQEATSERFERSGLEQLAEAERDGCVRREAWDVADAGAGTQALAGFPGVYRVAVPGHTPGSQLVVGFVADGAGVPRGVVVAGDVVNHRAGFERDLPKPWWYRWAIVREDEDVQARNRALLRALGAAGFEILVNHHVPVEGLASEACSPG